MSRSGKLDIRAGAEASTTECLWPEDDHRIKQRWAIPRPATRLLATALIVCAGVGCRSGHGATRVRHLAEPESFETAPVGSHRVGHAHGTCDLCDLYYKTRDHVVLVRTNAGLGAGIVVTTSGTILTNAHVVGEDAAPVIETYSGDTLAGRALKSDAARNLALVAVDEPTLRWDPMPVEPCPLPEVGSDVYVIGHPVGLGWTVTRGVVSATRTAGEIAPIPLIQTDAAISPGNSGGPLLDRGGHLLGVVSRKLAGPGIESVGFAIPALVAASFLAETPDSKPGSAGTSSGL